MINQNWLDKQLQIIVQRQEEISNKVIKVIVKRINEVGELKPSDIHTLRQLYRSGADVREINRLIAIGTAMQVQDIKHIIQITARDLYEDAKPFYDYRKKPFIPYKDNKNLQRIVNAIAKQTNNSFMNLSNSKATGFVLSDGTKTVFMDMKNAYQKIIDEAVQTLAFGINNYKALIRKSVKQLTASGVQGIHWESGYHQRLDTAVRRNILDAIRQMSIAVDEQIGKEIGADGVEISAHPLSAPDHEPIQGHCFTKENFNKLQNGDDFEDIYHNKFSGIARPIGEWNCRHITASVVIATYKPLYSLKELEEFKQANRDGYTTSKGKHYTLYECTQVQRRMETDIRRLKDEWLAFKELDDKDSMTILEGKISQKVAEYKLFSKECNIQAFRENLSVSGYKK